jgi:hypothetical protein
MKKVMVAMIVLTLLTGCAEFLPTVAVDGKISSNDGQSKAGVKGFMTQGTANELLKGTAQADRTIRVGEAQSDFIKSQAELNRTMGRVIEKNPDYLWYGFGLGLYGVGITSQWPEFQENIYYPEALTDWQNQTMPPRKEKK